MALTPARTGLRCFIINKFSSLFLFVLLYLGCFVFSNTDDKKKKKRKLAPTSPSSSSSPARLIKQRHNKSISSSSWSFIKTVFTKINRTLINKPDPSAQAATSVLTSARSSHRSLVQLDNQPPPPPQELLLEPPAVDMTMMITTTDDHDSSGFLFSLRNNDIYPCTACGEVFHKSQLLEQHQTVKHAVSELTGEDSGRNIVKIIFESSWTTTVENLRSPPRIHRILKIHNSSKVLYRFEEYRELVKSKAAAAVATFAGGGVRRRRDERCIADGNELLRFHCSTFMCQLGQDGNSTLCNQQFCSVCGIIRSGFSSKLDGISTMSTSWRAHVAISEETLEEFQFMNVKRAMLVCRVVAGRVGADDGEEELGVKEGGGFDSVVGRVGSGALDEEELLVFNPRAVLPCFVIVYTLG